MPLMYCTNKILTLSTLYEILTCFSTVANSVINHQTSIVKNYHILYTLAPKLTGCEGTNSSFPQSLLTCPRPCGQINKFPQPLYNCSTDAIKPPVRTALLITLNQVPDRAKFNLNSSRLIHHAPRLYC